MPAGEIKPYGFEKAERLLKRGEFLRILRQPERRFISDHFHLLLKQNQLPRTRLGVIISKKVGSAVKRNRVKRHLREFFRMNKHLLSSGLDLLVIVQPGAADIDVGRIKKELNALIRQSPSLTND